MFIDREDAGKQLARKLEKYKGEDPLVLGVPRGGVAIAAYIADYLMGELSVVVTKKLPYPLQPEYGIGAVCEEGVVYVRPDVSVPPLMVEPLVKEVREEVSRRVQQYRDGKPLPEMKGRVVILVDDGIATGATLVAAMRLCKRHEPLRIVIAAPVAGEPFDSELKEADEIVILEKPSFFYGVGQAYLDFAQLTDEDVQTFLRRSA